MAAERKTIFTVYEASPLRGEDLFFVGQIRNGKPSTNRVSLQTLASTVGDMVVGSTDSTDFVGLIDSIMES